MRDYKFVSVVIPTYNRKELLEECLEAVFNQTYPKDCYEVIVVDDGSTDGTNEILKEYEKIAPCKFVWFSQENRGPAAARNIGIKNAKGEIIYFTDDDCIPDKYWIENLAKVFNDERIVAVGGEFVSQEPQTWVETYESNILNQKNNIKVYILTGNSAFRRNLLESVGYFDEHLRRHEDVDLSFRIRLRGFDLTYVPKAKVYYRHITTLRGLVKQKYKIGVGLAQLCKKWTSLSFWYYLIIFTLKIVRNVLRLPFTLISRNRSKIVFEIIEIVVFLSSLIGLIKGAIFEKYYGSRVHDRLEFLEDETLAGLFRKLKSKTRIIAELVRKRIII